MKRTLSQNNSLHLWLRQLSEALNDAGLDMKKTLKPTTDIPWTEENAKEHLFKPLMEAMYNKDSTRELTTKELTKVAEVLTRHLAEKFDITTPFPSLDSLLLEEYESL